MENRKVILYISMSLDGFIATQDDDLSFLSVVEQEGEDYGYQEFVKTIDTYIVGRKTYTKIVEIVGHFPQAKEYDCYVITRQAIKVQDGVTFFNGNIRELIENLRSKPGKNIYCDGGGEIVQLFMQEDLIDEYIVSIIPVILGQGKRLFLGHTFQRAISLMWEKKYDSGLVQLAYRRDRSSTKRTNHAET